MPRGTIVENFSRQEKMRIAEVFRDAQGGKTLKLRAAKHFVRTVLDGNAQPNPRRDLTLKDGTVAYWVKKVLDGYAPQDDRRR